MNPLANFMEHQGYVVLDGALATELESRGQPLDGPLWSARCLFEQPALIRQVHLDYYLAGADVATSASYQASVAGFVEQGFSEKTARELIVKSVELACEARDLFWSEPRNRAGRLRPLVAASVGPYGAYLADGSEYTGRYGISHERLSEFHAERWKLLAHSGADLLALETIPCLQEAVVLAELLAQFPEKVAWLSFSCADGAHLSSGEPFAGAVALADRCPHIVAVGVNCTVPHFIGDLLKIARPLTNKPLVAYPNSGEGWDAAHHCWTGQPDATWAEGAAAWLASGASIIGGCCRTTPADIRHLRKAMAAARE